jgi:hypothetical protein
LNKVAGSKYTLLKTKPLEYVVAKAMFSRLKEYRLLDPSILWLENPYRLFYPITRSEHEPRCFYGESLQAEIRTGFGWADFRADFKKQFSRGGEGCFGVPPEFSVAFGDHPHYHAAFFIDYRSAADAVIGLWRLQLQELVLG